ncbi:MAG: sigma-E processing peptidase SpoIIGA [Eubacteriales bacterium]|nr:sigma-E processing peptidase SpoIIGA [Eubacteriales bacterium]
MVVYWDLVLLFNFLTDYLLLYCTAHLSGFGIRRGRIALGAFAGAAYAVVQLLFPKSVLLMLAVLVLMGALTFFGTGRAIRMTLLFAALACAFGGGVLLIGQMFGTTRQLARGVMFAELPWKVFFAAAVLSYLLLGFVFRGSAQHTDSELASVTIFYHGASVSLTLLRDTGNTLTDPQTGVGIPVVSEGALRRILSAEEVRCLPQIAYCCVGTQQGHLPVFYCDELQCDGVSLGARPIAVSVNMLGGGRYVGLWCEGR